MTRFLTLLIAFALVARVSAEEPVRITVVIVLASESHKEVNDKIKEVADAVQQKHPNLTGFKLQRTLVENIERGKTGTFKLPGDAKMEVSVHSQLDENGCLTLTIKPPTLGEITYHCKCGRYFPILTKFQPNKETDEKMILAIMAKPCAAK
jgi:hypothetical protein